MRSATAAATRKGSHRARPRVGARGDTSGGSGRTWEMPERTEPRREAGGGDGDVVGEQGCGLPQLGDLGAAVLAGGEVLLEPGALEVVDGVEGVGAGELVDVAHEPTPIRSRRRMSPSRIRVFAVPRGTSSMVATSVWV